MTSAELFEIAIGFLDTYKYEKAIDYFTKTIELDPTNSEAYELRGIGFYKLLKINEAIEDFQKAVEINSEQPQCMVQQRRNTFLPKRIY